MKIQLASPGSLSRSRSKRYPHNHLQSLLDGFVDFSGVENCELTFKGLSLNSKKVHEEYLFLACAGVGNSPHHGVAYAGEAINSGASCIAWEPTQALNEMPVNCPVPNMDNKAEAPINHVPLIRVEKLHEKLGEIASRFYQHPSHDLNVIGITGTNGKTSTAHFVAQLMSFTNDAHCAVIGTLGNGLYGQLEKSTHTTPDAVTLQALIDQYKKQKADTLVMEVSSHALSQGRVNGVEFDCAVLTNLTRDHLDYHGDMQAYADEKLKLFQWPSLKHIIVNQDDAFSQVIIDSVSKSDASEKPAITRYSRKDSSADYFVKDSRLNNEGISFTLCVNEKQYTVKSQLVGEFTIENLLAAIAVLHRQGYELNDIVAGVANIVTVSGRMEKIRLEPSAAKNKVGVQPLIVIDYAHTPDALEQVLKALKIHTKGKLYCVFGCGGDRDKGKRPLMAEVAQQVADQIIVTSDNPRTESEEQIISDIISGFEHQDNVLIEADRNNAIHTAIRNLSADDVLLIAGKGHEDYQEINGQRLPFSDKESVLSFYDSFSERGESF
ncbi:MAG: UDP-N-acetylmuramoyl-L-alanyl-D-glutamate--2,6-diaminopimelate ligase [gamma proteobacterium symbiont of Bathyaustriella thionipta]|nr:UDP-N-acetylmuramoyl-L-alanyl-D-glutamate--2,6-diaminopimelate ligase [gamma proteobacterium symbiont of Bathyaustriella thionipta]MCU7949318.1 UDP-N-acetylmuramoyl-L-alanyl-D-glutamate--2,6-diaminopimelate ligase [gamma proteobacterium symbiont of Bathyaustriella thionipta]MCU7953378.1 UDP-N-acetylmuramoyl-L-alanyl-D-glutamate--2,6-diaminopimelate ligase [gamma proteobacterium symbiont of Bathyaustriella thionipta]MCU7955897.1 UDP-N-acetylmuramoyl-L-alanyl-D-glutamate--2,6-diaminopimelate li